MKVSVVRTTGTSAGLCRANGWTVGDVLEGDEGYGPTRIVITAIGEAGVLARAISHAGKPRNDSEGIWTLLVRDWKKVPSAEMPSAAPKEDK